jgi:hypothetical protein
MDISAERGITPQRGRKPRDKIEILRTRFWCAVVLDAAGCSGPYCIEKLLYPDQFKYVDGKIKRPGKWDGYASGKHSPTASNGDSPVDTANGLFPGTAAIYRSPIWAALSTRNWTETKAVAALATLPPHIAALTTYERIGANESDLWRTRVPTFTESTKAALLADGTFHALAALVIFVRLSDSLGTPALRSLALAGIMSFAARIPNDTSLTSAYKDLHREIDLNCPRWIHIDAVQRIEVVLHGSAWEGHVDISDHPDPDV